MIYHVYDRTDRNIGSKVPVAVTTDPVKAQAYVDDLRSGLPDHAKCLVYFNSEIPEL